MPTFYALLERRKVGCLKEDRFHCSGERAVRFGPSFQLSPPWIGHKAFPVFGRCALLVLDQVVQLVLVLSVQPKPDRCDVVFGEQRDRLVPEAGTQASRFPSVAVYVRNSNMFSPMD